MKRMIALLTACLLIFVTACAKRASFVTIGTGGVTGVYYPTGGAISRMINNKSDVYDIKMTVESTGGSVYNINAILNGDMDFGLAQSDRQYQAYEGLAEWKELGPQKALRSVFSIYPESVTLVAAENSGIKTLSDLKGKRVNLGNPGSGQLQNARDVLAAAGITDEDIQAEHVKAVEAAGLLQDDRLDAFFYTVGHPNGSVKEATAGRRKVQIIPIRGPAFDELIKEKPYYAKSTIPVSKNYPMAVHPVDVESIGVKATLVTSAQIPNETVYAITKEVFENLDVFRNLHPAYATITPEKMLKGLSAPIHPGAMKYYREAGLDQYINPALMAP